MGTEQRPAAATPRIVIAALAIAAILATQFAILYAMGQPTICTCGYVKLWHGEIASSENSQHLMDWWTYTHVLHGLVFYFVIWLLMPRVPLTTRLVLVVAIEAGWEAFENTPLIINRYRQAALALDYFGDSIVNSLADTVAAISGFALSAILPLRFLVLLFVASELLSAYLIRDNLLLNVIQLIYPTEWISNWQAGTL